MADLKSLRRVIKAAQRQMAMEDDAYRLLLKRVTGKTSCTQLNAFQCNQVLDEFKRLGWRAKSRKNSGQIARIQYLWLCLRDAGKLTNGTKQALYRWCDRYTQNTPLHKAAPETLSTIIEQLKAWCDREEVDYE